MSNKQILPNTKLEGVFLKKKITSSALSNKVMDFSDDKSGLEVVSDVTNLAKNTATYLAIKKIKKL